MVKDLSNLLFLSMRLLLFSDLHVSKSHCEHLVEISEDADVVIGAGDFGSLRMGISKTIGWLKQISKPAVLVPGNAESFKELKKASKNWPSAYVLHGNGMELNGIEFYGIGGGIPVTPFGPWSYDFTEEEARELLLECPKNSVLVSHSPPYGILDLSSRGQHLGSTAVLQAIENKSPQLVVCGHIHESGGKIKRFGNTDVVNAGPKGILYELSKS